MRLSIFRNCIFFVTFCILIGSGVVGQTELSGLPRYESPLQLPVRLSATFGELRANHFHAGIDLKTQQKTGFPVGSVDEGYVARVAVSPTGYGKVVYVAHPNGYTSVYGHLDGFAPGLDTLVEMQQYARKSFAVDWELLPGQYRLKKKQLIGFSGNTGGSGGPHVHLEIRDTRTQDALNPLDFGFAAKDFIRPKIEFLKIYPGEKGSLINDRGEPVRFELAGWGPSYRLKVPDTVRVSGSFAVGVACHDLLNYEPNKNGVWGVAFMADSVPFFTVEMRRIAFSDTRYIYAMTDYAAYRASGDWVIWSKQLPGNRLPFIRATNGGRVAVKPGRVIHVQVDVKDLAGNVSILRFVVKGEVAVTADSLPSADSAMRTVPVAWDKPLGYSSDGLAVEADSGSFYDNFLLTVDTLERGASSFSPVYRLNPGGVPIHKSLTLRIKTDRAVAEDTDKLLIASVGSKGALAAVGGQYKEGVVTVRIRDFGLFTVVMDTTAPRIKALNVRNKMQLDTIRQVRFTISDDFSGIASIVPELNGRWHLMEYDAKNKLLFCSLKRFVKGENRLKITLTDQKGNVANAEYILYL